MLFVVDDYFLKDSMLEERYGEFIGRLGEDEVVDIQSLFALYSFEERPNKANPWQPFFQALPNNFDNLPVLYGEPLLKLLEGTSFLRTVREDKLRAQKQHEMMQEMMPEVPLEQFIIYRL
mmetsp:Transcript_15163/g.14753  ORF Transcript_15163/g.14753 Transcript_15163/m.14753 type:complete len:120 (+) Transcript_15163:244-603(+)